MLDPIGEAGLYEHTNETSGDGANRRGDDGGCLNHCDVCVSMKDGYMR